MKNILTTKHCAATRLIDQQIIARKAGENALGLLSATAHAAERGEKLFTETFAVSGDALALERLAFGDRR